MILNNNLGNSERVSRDLQASDQSKQKQKRVMKIY